MKIIVISRYSVIREGIAAVLSKSEDITIQFVCETIKEAMLMIKGNMADVMLLDIHKDNEEELNLISELRTSGVKILSIILDFYEDNELFIKALKCGVQGYILGNSSEEEIVYAIEEVYKGKKYFDSYFVDFMINENNDLPNRLELLTFREREILIEIAKGLSNQKIADKFFITENTVKKHISHIFEKLNISDRAEAALYVNKYGMANR
jgi:two-component system, NarL family, response regulator